MLVSLSQICKKLRGVLFIIQGESDTIKLDFMHTKRTTFPTKMKTGIHLEELKQCTEIGTFLLLECSPIRKTNMFENADLYRTNWRKRYFDPLSCYHTRHIYVYMENQRTF